MSEQRAILDLEAYASKYQGHQRVQRLLFIAEKNANLKQQALQLAIQQVKTKTQDTRLYLQTCEKLSMAPDTVWVSTTDTKCRMQQEKLENELNSYKTNQIKESIRMGHNDLADFFYQRGLLEQALRIYIKSRDYCATSKHIIQTSLNVIRVAVEMKEFGVVESYVNRAEQTPDVNNDDIVVNKLKCCAALSLLSKKRYQKVAERLVSCSLAVPAPGSGAGSSSNITGEEYARKLAGELSDVLSLDDIGLYGGLCALATFSREELYERVLQPTAPFRAFIELFPEVRELISDFYASRYTSALAYLEKLEPDLQLDIFMHEHIASLYSMIRCKALIQYVYPYVSVELQSMATAFNTDVDSLQFELVQLIDGGLIDGRIDAYNRVFCRTQEDRRVAALQSALQVGRQSLLDMDAVVLRMKMNKAGLIVNTNSDGYLSDFPRIVQDPQE